MPGLTTQIASYIEQLARAQRKKRRQISFEHGVNPLQLELLFFLAATPMQVTVKVLASEMEITEATVSDSLRSLSDKGMITKKADAADNRIRRVTLTPRGKKLVEKLRQRAELTLDNLPEATQLDLTESLHRLVATVFLSGELSHARICQTCVYFVQENNARHCMLLKKNLTTLDLQHDCSDHRYRS